MQPIKLDLRRDLPKVRKRFKQVLGALGPAGCDYTAPCVVGAMLPPAKREFLEEGIDFSLTNGGNAISELIKAGIVSVPNGQERDFISLQLAFDSGEKSKFESVLKRVEAKYLETVEA